MMIGLDIDGVILDFERTMQSFAELYDLLMLKKDGIKYPEHFDCATKYDWTKDEKEKFYDDYLVYATLHKTPLIPLAKTMLELFKIENYQFVFITARGTLRPETKEAVIRVFVNNGIPIDNIQWSVTDKASKCKELGVDVMIEDNPNICKQLVEGKIRTLYFRDKNGEKLEEGLYLHEVSNVGEICRCLFDKNELKNSCEAYEKILRTF